MKIQATFNIDKRKLDKVSGQPETEEGYLDLLEGEMGWLLDSGIELENLIIIE